MRPSTVVVSLLAAAATLLGAVGSQDPHVAVAEGVSVRFAAAGDFGADARMRAVVGAIGASDPDLTLALGDLSYGVTATEQEWCDLVLGAVGAGSAFQLVAGNHESNGQHGNINDFSACLPNQLPGLVGVYGRQWYVDVPAGAPLVRFVMISPALPFPDGTWTYGAGSPRLAWTAAAIDGARAAGVPWVVVGMHKTCLSMGSYPCEIGQALFDLLVDRRVDLVLTGHEHLYQRTHQLAHGPACPSVVAGTFNPGCVAGSSGTHRRGDGTVVVTVGTGGTPQYAVQPGDPEAPYFAAARGATDASWGHLEVAVDAERLTGRFVRAAGAAFEDTFAIGPPSGTDNQPPVAAIAVSCEHLTCAFDGRGSTDPDGSVVAWSWAFGDGATATGSTASRAYVSAGTYTVSLTVTDDAGARATVQRQVTVTAPPPPPTTVLARDTFDRSVTNGWGSAATGGAWRLTGATSLYAVADGTGRVRVNAGSGPDVSLPSVAAASTDLSLTLSPDKVPGGSGMYPVVAVRRVPGVGEYRALLQLRADSRVALGLGRVVSGTEATMVARAVRPGLTLEAGERLAVRVQAVGTSPTTLRARVWKHGEAEPTVWHASVVDQAAGLQAAGAIGLNLYLSSSATNAPVTVHVDDVLAEAAG